MLINHDDVRETKILPAFKKLHDLFIPLCFLLTIKFILLFHWVYFYIVVWLGWIYGWLRKILYFYFTRLISHHWSVCDREVHVWSCVSSTYWCYWTPKLLTICLRLIGDVNNKRPRTDPCCTPAEPCTGQTVRHQYPPSNCGNPCENLTSLWQFQRQESA